jgi:hypothetical protein
MGHAIVALVAVMSPVIAWSVMVPVFDVPLSIRLPLMAPLIVMPPVNAPLTVMLLEQLPPTEMLPLRVPATVVDDRLLHVAFADQLRLLAILCG